MYYSDCIFFCIFECVASWHLSCWLMASFEFLLIIRSIALLDFALFFKSEEVACGSPSCFCVCSLSAQILFAPAPAPASVLAACSCCLLLLLPHQLDGVLQQFRFFVFLSFLCLFLFLFHLVLFLLLPCLAMGQPLKNIRGEWVHGSSRVGVLPHDQFCFTENCLSQNGYGRMHA